jgi:hypothetical protein
MKKLVVAASFAALATYPAAACDWNHEASAKDAVVAATGTTTEQAAPQAATPASPQATSVAADASARKPLDEWPPIVLVTDRH